MSESCTTAVAIAAPRRARARRLPHSVAIVAVLVLFMAASSAPSSLYVVYQQDGGSPLSVVFAVYVLGLIGSADWCFTGYNRPAPTSQPITETPSSS
jgi:hypothetical protein